MDFGSVTVDLLQLDNYITKRDITETIKPTKNQLREAEQMKKHGVDISHKIKEQEVTHETIFNIYEQDNLVFSCLKTKPFL